MSKGKCSKRGVILAFIHWVLCADDFRCVGTGEKFEGVQQDSEPSENLPTGWKNGEAPLRYIDTKTKNNFVLYSFATRGDNMQVALMRTSDKECGARCVRMSDVVGDEGKLSEPLRWAREFADLVEPFRPKKETTDGLLISEHKPASPQPEPNQPGPFQPGGPTRDPPGGGPFQPKPPKFDPWHPPFE